MTLKTSRFKPWLVLFVCWLTFGESSAWAQHVGLRHPSEGYYSSIQSEPGVYDPEKHKKSYAKWVAAAEQGDADAQVNVGYYNDFGRDGRPDDNAAAIMWYTKAAEQGNARGQLNLGAMYTRGKGVPKDDATARMWYTST